MRARLGLKLSDIEVELREITLKNKPTEMLDISPKGTVPVLYLQDNSVIDESLDIILWALTKDDPNELLKVSDSIQQQEKQLIHRNDFDFKKSLDCYKYSERFPEYSMEHYRSKGEEFLVDLDSLLKTQAYLFGNTLGLADIAIFPFVRQFAHVDRNWFYATKYSFLIAWLKRLLESDLFLEIMQKYPEYLNSDERILM